MTRDRQWPTAVIRMVLAGYLSFFSTTAETGGCGKFFMGQAEKVETTKFVF